MNIKIPAEKYAKLQKHKEELSTAIQTLSTLISLLTQQPTPPITEICKQIRKKTSMPFRDARREKLKIDTNVEVEKNP